MPKNIISINNLVFNRGKKKVFDDININIQKNKITAIIGPSGTGKTTLLRIICGQLKPEKGEVIVDGQDIFKVNKKALFRLRKKMGMLFQSGALLSDMNVFDNIAFVLKENTNLSEELIHHLVMMRLESVGLRGAKDLMPNELSGGMARRVALARALIMDPKFVIYDEPFTGQDPISKSILVKLIKTVNDALNISSIIVTHDVSEAFEIADYVFVVFNGKIMGQGTVQSLNNSSSKWVDQFIHAKADGPVPFHYEAKPYIDDLIGKWKIV